MLNLSGAICNNVTVITFPTQDLDGADDLLNAERQHLLKLKRILEAQLRSVQKQLQVLDGARKRLRAALQERTRVLDLICHAVSAVRGAGIKDQTEKPKTPPVEALGPYTPECARVISAATEARERSVNLRKEVAEAIEQTVKLQQAAHHSVNDGLTQKVAETVTMRVSGALMFSPFTPKSDQFQISPAASPVILHHTVWRA